MADGSSAGTLARRWFEEVWNARRETMIDELMADDVVCHLEGQDAHSSTEFREAREELLELFPDLAVTVEDVLEQGDQAAIRWTAAGTHRGDALGFPGTGRQVRFRGMTWLRFSEGRIVEGWDSWNFGGLAMVLAEEDDESGTDH